MTQTRNRGDSGPTLAAGEERRRSQRVIIRIPVTIYYAHQGRSDNVSAFTLAVNDHGALLHSPRNFPSGTSIEVENESTHERIPCKVTRQPQPTSDGFQVPVAFDKPHSGFWHISFPPSDWKPTDV